jgi:hypothetical protein
VAPRAESVISTGRSSGNFGDDRETQTDGRIPLCGKHVLLYGPTLRIGLTISQWSSATDFSPLTGIAALARFYLSKSSFRLAEF